MKQITVNTYWAKIYISGQIVHIENAVREYCLSGLCVTVTPTNYIYAQGEESGAEIGLINYPRFPATNAEIDLKAQNLAELLMERCHQGSYTIMTPTKTTFYSRRDYD
jgi:hypothetical protein|tara:strand:+ start:14309 stop:14632 length:324 start_codon:yes stop_codon:yes gene_type:complete